MSETIKPFRWVIPFQFHMIIYSPTLDFQDKTTRPDATKTAGKKHSIKRTDQIIIIYTHFDPPDFRTFITSGASLSIRFFGENEIVRSPISHFR